MEYLRYLNVLRRYGWIVILLAAIGAGSSAFFTQRQPKVYQATTTLLINPAAPNQAISYIQQAVSSGANGQSSLQQLAQTYGVYLQSGAFGAVVQKSLHLAASPSGQISSSLIGNTNFFEIDVTDHDPAQATRIANGVATQFIQQNLQLQGATTASANLVPLANVNKGLAPFLQKQIAVIQKQELALNSGNDVKTAAVQTELAALDTRLSNLVTAYNTLVSGSGNTASQAALNTAKVVGPAVTPTGPISPSLSKNVIFGGVAGLAIGLMLVYLLEYLDYSLRSPEDVEVATGQLPLAVIALAGKPRRAAKSAPAVAPDPNGAAPSLGLFSLTNPHDAVSEAFRSLRTNLAFSTLDRPARSFVVTSVQPGEGKTTVAANLAVVMAQSDMKVILVDADLRRPSLHRVFGLRNTTGFTDLLLAKGRIVSGLQATSIPNLTVLTSGPLPPNPAELLSSPVVVPLIQVLTDLADVVIFDTAPMGVLTDAVVLSTRVEGSLMVVKAGAARPRVVTKGLETLKKVGSRPMGVVLNMVNVKQLGGYSYYYHYARHTDYGAVS